MDDIRRPQRRDYALPSHRPDQPEPQRPAPHQPQHQPAPPPVYHRPPQPLTYEPMPVHHPHHQIHPQPHRATPQRAKVRLPGKKLSLIAAIALAAAAVFGAGYLLKGSGSADTIPPSIISQAKYDLYFPSPMPPGYSYMKDTATFEIGEVFYKFSHGNKRVTVKEEPLVGDAPNLNQLTGWAQFDTAVGKAAIGSSVGETAAMVVTPTTIITINTINGVSQQDIKTAIDNFQNIGQKTQ